MARFLVLVLISLSSVRGVHARDLDQLYEKAQFKLGATKFTAYIADDEQKRAQGLMYIEKLPENTGMLFVFEQEQPLNFWMKNTLLPLTAAFVEDDGTITNLADMKPLDETSHCSTKPVRYVLEMNQGWFEQRHLHAGAKLRGPVFANNPR